MGEWITDRKPKSEQPVLVTIEAKGKRYVQEAMWIAAKTVEEKNQCNSDFDYDDSTDTYYCTEGWYVECWACECSWRILGAVLGWREMPEPML